MARAGQTGEPDNLTGASLEIDPPEDAPSNAHDAEQGSRGDFAGWAAAYVDDLAHHGGDQFRQRQLGRLPCSHSPAVAEHGDPVGDLEHFLEMMGDVEDGQSTGAEGLEDPEELVGFGS